MVLCQKTGKFDKLGSLVKFPDFRLLVECFAVEDVSGIFRAFLQFRDILPRSVVPDLAGVHVIGPYELDEDERIATHER